MNVIAFWSGATNGTSRAGDGGGLVLLGAINLVVDGAIRADGGLPTGTSQIGMGAGGGVNLRLRTAGLLTGAGLAAACLLLAALSLQAGALELSMHEVIAALHGKVEPPEQRAVIALTAKPHGLQQWRGIDRLFG